jgi:hypothetical protein
MLSLLLLINNSEVNMNQKRKISYVCWSCAKAHQTYAQSQLCCMHRKPVATKAKEESCKTQ